MRILLAIVASAFIGCQHFQDTVGCYTHTDWTTGYAHNFGDPGGGGISGVLAPEHGNFGESNFNIERADQYAEDRIETGLTLRFSPGACL